MRASSGGRCIDLLSDFGGGQFYPHHDAGDRLVDPVFRAVAAGADAQGARVEFHLPAERPQALVVEFDRARKTLMVDDREVAAAVDQQVDPAGDDLEILGSVDGPFAQPRGAAETFFEERVQPVGRLHEVPGSDLGRAPPAEHVRRGREPRGCRPRRIVAGEEPVESLPERLQVRIADQGKAVAELHPLGDADRPFELLTARPQPQRRVDLPGRGRSGELGRGLRLGPLRPVGCRTERERDVADVQRIGRQHDHSSPLAP